MKRPAAIVWALLLVGCPVFAETTTATTDAEVRKVVSRYSFESQPQELPADPIRDAVAAEDTGALAAALAADLNAKNVAGQTTLMTATVLRKPRVMRFLMERGADVNARGPRQATALFLAAERGYGPIVELLLNEGADIELQADDDVTPLIAAVIHERYGVVEILLKAGANVNRKMKGGLAPYDFARLSGNEDLLDLLQRSGGRPGEEEDVLATTVQ